MSKDKFWMVWSPNKGLPSKKHDDESYAKIEAERLARLNNGTPFYVLEATYVSVTEKPVTTTKLEYVPF